MNGSTAVIDPPSASSNFTTYGLWQMMNSVDLTVFSMNALFGVPTHSYVIWLITRGTSSEYTSEFFNLNLSVCELIYSLNSVLFVLCCVVFRSVFFISLFFLGLGITGRPLFLCLICVERYLAVVHPVKFLKCRPLRYRVICCAVVWFICLISCSLCVYILQSTSFFTLTWGIANEFIFFLSIQLFCCVAVLRVLKKSGPGERGREREEENHMKRRAFHFILLTTVTMVILFVPFILTGILNVLQQEISVIWSFSLVCFISAAFVNPLVFLWRRGKLNFCSVENLLS